MRLGLKDKTLPLVSWMDFYSKICHSQAFQGDESHINEALAFLMLGYLSV